MSDSKISISDVEHVAKLANLTISNEDAIKFQQQLSAVVEHFEVLNQVDVTAVEITAQVTGLENITRKDHQGDRSLSQTEAISLSPKNHNGYILVPSILANRTEE